MVVKIESGFAQPLRLRVAQRAQRHAGFHPQRLYALHHLFQVRHIAVVGVFPRRAHAETRRSRRLRLTCRGQHLFHLHQALRLKAGFITGALRAIFAILRAGAGLDRQQRTDLHLSRIEVLPVDLLRFKHQFKKRFIKQGLSLCQRPAHRHCLLQKVSFLLWNRIILVN